MIVNSMMMLVVSVNKIFLIELLKNPHLKTENKKLIQTKDKINVLKL